MSLKETINNKKVKGILVKVIDNPCIVLISKECGMDFMFYDMEHGCLSLEKLHDLMLLGNQMNFDSIVRVPELSKAFVSRVLDYGAKGVMVPMIETKEDAIKLVNWSKYAPIGNRSYSGGANTNYGSSGNHKDNMFKANNEILTIAQIESLKGVNNIDDILSVDGIDACIIGPCDLGISINNPDDVFDKKELELINKVSASCKKHQKKFGIIANNKLLEYYKVELDIFVSSIDTGIIRNGIKNAVIDYNKIMENINDK